MESHQSIQAFPSAANRNLPLSVSWALQSSVVNALEQLTHPTRSNVTSCHSATKPQSRVSTARQTSPDYVRLRMFVGESRAERLGSCGRTASCPPAHAGKLAGGLHQSGGGGQIHWEGVCAASWLGRAARGYKNEVVDRRCCSSSSFLVSKSSSTAVNIHPQLQPPLLIFRLSLRLP